MKRVVAVCCCQHGKLTPYHIYSFNKHDTYHPLHSSRIGEQESKAIKHVHQLGLLAHKLNRTLILPPMWKSRFGTCYRNPFSYYYHEEALSRFGIPSVTFEAFQLWSSRRFSPPQARIYDILSSPTTESQQARLSYASVTQSRDIPSFSKHNHCLSDKAPRTSFKAPAVIIGPLKTRWHLNVEETNGLASDIIETLGADKYDVMAISWELRHPLFPVSADVHLQYAPRWTDLVHTISRDIGPFIAVHWRMETVPFSQNQMPSCAMDLISTIKWILNLHRKSSISGTEDALTFDIATVYLATDYPLEGTDSTSIPHSGTFKDVRDEHHDALRVVREAFQEGGALSTLSLTSLHTVLLKYRKRENALLHNMDSGLMGILDKTIAMRADWFVSGSRVCSRQRYVANDGFCYYELGLNSHVFFSSFTEQIISTRRQLAADGEGLRNIVDYFGVEEA